MPRQDSWGAYIPKRLLEKAAVTERKGGSGYQGVRHARRRAVGLLGSFPPMLTITGRESGDSSEPNGPFSIFISQLGAECSFFIVSRLFQLWEERWISCDAMIYVSCSLFQKGEKR